MKGMWHGTNLKAISPSYNSHKGWLGLYKGLSSPLLGSMAENAVLFWSYGIFKGLLGEKEAKARGEELSLLQLSLAGAGAGAVVPCVLTPVELIKCRLQVG